MRTHKHCRPLLAACLLATASTAPAGTTTTTYTYNADGALTALTVQAGGGAATTYVTWDYFTPDAENPATGTLAAANGRLTAIGSTPGGTPQFRFDTRDRLTGVASSGSTEGYAYHAHGLLRQATLGDDALDFYYGSGAHPTVVNQAQPSTGRTSAHLGAARFLSDGTEQVLLAPRKDTAALLDPAAGAVSAYDYDPFGAQPGDGVQTAGYDLADNPFQYAGEYRDPLWGGIYLRARWYHPDLPGFISRDPAQNLNRFAYAGGNPVMHVDPGGRNFFHGMEHFLQGLNRDLNKGVGGHFARFFLAPEMGLLAIAANPQAFWQGIKTNRDQMDVFLALGVASELAGGLMDAAAVNDVVGWSRGRRWGLRSLSDIAIGGGQSVAAGADRGFHHFNWHNFVAGMELTAGVSLFDRGVLGMNVRSGYKEPYQAGALADDLRSNPVGSTLIYRVRTKLPASQAWLNWLPIPMDSPLQDALGLGLYHEKLIAVTNFDHGDFGGNTIAETELVNTGMFRREGRVTHSLAFAKLTREAESLELVGRVDNFDRRAFFANPRNVNVLRDFDRFSGRFDGSGRYRLLTNNCHYHAYAVLKGLGLR